MGATRKKLDEANMGGREMLTLQAHQGSYRKRGRMVAKGLSLQAGREVLAQIWPQYREASAQQKRLLLDSFTQITRYHRTYAIWFRNLKRIFFLILLNQVGLGNNIKLRKSRVSGSRLGLQVGTGSWLKMPLPLIDGRSCKPGGSVVSSGQG